VLIDFILNDVEFEMQHVIFPLFSYSINIISMSKRLHDYKKQTDLFVSEVLRKFINQEHKPILHQDMTSDYLRRFQEEFSR
jgi:hypothetical protein